MQKLLTPFCLVCCLQIAAQAVHYSGTPFTAPGACSPRFTQPFSFLVNPAALCRLSQAGAAVFSEKNFGLKELSRHMAAAVLPLRKDGVGLALQYAGYNAFNESRVAIAYGKNLGKLSLGLQFHYDRVSMAGYGSDGAVGTALGAICVLTPKLLTGMYIANPLGGKFQRYSGEKLASEYRLGFGYEASEQVCISADIIKEENRPLNVLACIQYHVLPQRLFTRLGIATATAEPFLGAGWQWRNCRADVLVRYHSQLGFSPALQLVFYGKQKTEK